jgi:hypothetical protein
MEISYNFPPFRDIFDISGTESYGTTTCHYITDTWEMKGVVLETKKMDGHHSSENISQELESGGSKSFCFSFRIPVANGLRWK